MKNEKKFQIFVMILDKTKKLRINGNVCLTRKIEEKKKFQEEKQKIFENIFRKHLERSGEFSCFSTHANLITIT